MNGYFNQAILNTVVNQFGGPQQFQQAMNAAQNMMQQTNMTPQQIVQNKLQSGELSQEAYNNAIQRANSIFGRR